MSKDKRIVELESELDESKKLWVLKSKSLHKRIKDLEAEVGQCDAQCKILSEYARCASGCHPGIGAQGDSVYCNYCYKGSLTRLKESQEEVERLKKDTKYTDCFGKAMNHYHIAYIKTRTKLAKAVEALQKITDTPYDNIQEATLLSMFIASQVLSEIKGDK